ncbi:MAG: hypothetical protein SGARI_002719 [Bacillariaceae sp.]
MGAVEGETSVADDSVGTIFKGEGGRLGDVVTETSPLPVNSDATVIRETVTDGVCDGCMLLVSSVR